MALDRYAPIIGTHVALRGDGGTFPVCGRCRSREGIIGKGIFTHPGHLRCACCGKHLSWVGASHMDALLASANAPKRKAARS